LQGKRPFDPEQEATFPWSRFSSMSTAPYKPGKTARTDTSPQRSLSNPANLLQKEEGALTESEKSILASKL
jgi:hypothetical protein